MPASASSARIGLLAASFAVVIASSFAQDDAPSVDPRAYTRCTPLEAPPLERCTYVRQNPLCARDEAFVPYLETHYCSLAGDGLVSGLAAVALVVVFFGTLATVAERFFVPSLNNISRALRLPADVAGATLLSFGNGAPDIFAQIAALSHRDVGESVALAVGAVTGAGMFITSFVFPCVILVALPRYESRSFGLDKWSFSRDTWFYAVASAAALYFFIDGEIEAWEAASLFSLYILYIVVLLGHKHVKRRLRRMRRMLEQSPSSSFEWSDSSDSSDSSDGDDDEGGNDVQRPILAQGNREAEEEDGDEEAGGDQTDSDSSDDDDTTSNSSEARRTTWRAVYSNICFAAKQMEIPLVATLRLTMPELGRTESLARRHVVVLPITAPLFMLLATGMLPGHIRWVGVLYGLAVSAVCAFILAHSWPHIGERRSVQALLTTCAFFQSILWMNTTASELVSLLSAVGKVSGVSEALLGATVLAWGNSVGDFISNTVVSREGNPNMAIAACFAGPMMNLLVGTSFGLLLHIAAHGPVTGYVMPNELILLGGALMVSVFYACVVIPIAHRWEITKKPAYGMIGFYVAFSVVYALTCTHCIFKKPWLGPLDDS